MCVYFCVHIRTHTYVQVECSLRAHVTDLEALVADMMQKQAELESALHSETLLVVCVGVRVCV